MHRVVLVVCAVLAFTSSAEPKTGHPLIKAYEGSTLSEQSSQAYDEVDVVTGKTKDGKSQLEKVAGKATYLEYKLPKGRTELEVSRNYEAALKSAGFELVFACAADACPQQCQVKGLNCIYESGSRYIAAKLARAEGDVWVMSKTTAYTTLLSVIESKPMDTGKVKVDAAALAKGIDADGHVAVYGIVFDTGKADLKPESSAVLDEISKLLSQRPELKIHVVGHTDNVGDFASNLGLSKKRAESVVKELTSKKYGIASNRLRPDGVGPLVPLATNDTDAGRAKNRRVDLVKQ